MEKFAERATCHWVTCVRNLMRQKGLKPLVFVNHVGLCTEHHRVAIERDTDLAGWRFDPVRGRHAKSRSGCTSCNSSFDVRIHI